MIDVPRGPDDDRMHHSASLAILPLSSPGSLFAAALFVLRDRAAAPWTTFAVAHAIEDFREAKVDLPLLHVDADDLHLDLVAEAVDLLRVFAPQQVRALDEAIVVVRHRRAMNHPL